MSSEGVAALIGAGATVLATLVGAYLGYLTTNRHAARDIVRRRSALATAIHFELLRMRAELYGCINSSGSHVPKVGISMYDQFVTSLELFAPTTVSAIFLLRESLKSVSPTLPIDASKPLDPSLKKLADSIREVNVHTATLGLPLLEEALTCLEREGAKPFAVSPAVIQHLVASSQADLNKSLDATLFMPPRVPTRRDPTG